MAAAMSQYVYSSSSAREHHVVNKNRPWCVFLCFLKINVFAISCVVETSGQQQYKSGKHVQALIEVKQY